MAIWLHSEKYPALKISNRKILKNWIAETILSYGKKPGEINYIFVSDNELLEINQNYLNHDYFTDVISFNYSKANVISGDIFISVERVMDNSILLESDFNSEILRVLIHGILHFLGFNDSTESEIAEMRNAENKHLKTVKAFLIFSV